MTCACSAAGPCVVHDGAWARLRSFVLELSRNDFVSHNPAPTLRIDGRDVPVDLVVDAFEGLRDTGLLPRWSPDDDPVVGGATWEPCDTVHPGPAGRARRRHRPARGGASAPPRHARCAGRRAMIRPSWLRRLDELRDDVRRVHRLLFDEVQAAARRERFDPLEEVHEVMTAPSEEEAGDGGDGSVLVATFRGSVPRVGEAIWTDDGAWKVVDVAWWVRSIPGRSGVSRACVYVEPLRDGSGPNRGR